jgi:hypothetical protein
MAILSGYLPVEQGIACYAALRKHADAILATGEAPPMSTSRRRS